MKSIYKKITLGVLLACSLVSCDLDTTPTNYLPSTDAFKSTKLCESVLNGTWSLLMTDGSTYASIGLGALMMNDDFAGSDVVWISSYGYSSSYNLTNGYGRGEINNMVWNLFYRAINNCNNVIAYVDQAEGTTADKNRIKGQALAMRGYVYMLLATHYSFGVGNTQYADYACAPIYTEPADMNMALTGKPASTVKEVFDRSLADLKEAYTLIPDDYDRGSNATDRYRIDKTVTKGLLARTSLYAAQWEDAYKYAAEAIDAKDGYLMNEAEFKSGFNDATNKEWMWGFSATIEDNMAAYNFNFKDCTTQGSYYNSFNVDPYFKEEQFKDKDDYRGDLFAWGLTAYRSVWTLLNYKFKFADVNNSLADIILMRVAEMYLIKAEAATHLAGKDAEAQTLLKQLRQARSKTGQAADVTATGDALREQIWMERRKELWGEGFSLTDLIRNQKSLERKNWSHYVECTLDDKGKSTGVPKLENGQMIFADNQSDDYKKERCTQIQGHISARTVFPDGSAFAPNSKYYLFRIPEQEELQNANLYTEHPRLPFY